MNLLPEKVPPSILKCTVFKNLGSKRKDVIVGPSEGEDAAIIRVEDQLLALHCDPISGAYSNIGWIAKINRLSLLRTLFGEVIIPKKVYVETTSEQSADSILIGKAAEEDWIKVSEEMKKAQAPTEASSIHLGEAEAILLARGLGVGLIVDEKPPQQPMYSR